MQRNGSRTHAVVDVPGNLPAMVVTPAKEQDRAQVGELAERVQQVTDPSVELAYVDKCYTGEFAASQAEQQSIRLEVVKHTEAK